MNSRGSVADLILEDIAKLMAFETSNVGHRIETRLEQILLALSLDSGIPLEKLRADLNEHSLRSRLELRPCALVDGNPS
jgi:hypothetical protein